MAKLAQRGKNPTCNAGDLGWENLLEKGTATHSVFLPEESMDRGAWQATVNGVTKSQT